MKNRTIIRRALTVAIALFGAVAASLAQTPTTWSTRLSGVPPLETTGHEYIQVVSLDQGEFGLRADGHIDFAGEDQLGESQIPNGLTAIQIAAGSVHGLALRANHTIVAWGYEEYGQISGPNGLGNVAAIAAGGENSYALMMDGTVRAWGDNWSGQLYYPSDLGHVVKIAAGQSSWAVLRSDGTVCTFGYGGTVNTDLTNVVDIACGYGFTVALKADGTVEERGSIWAGTPPDGLTDVVKIGAGYGMAFAVKSDGTVVCWGDDYYGFKNVPSGLDPIVQITCGGIHAVALTGVAGNLTTSKTSFYGGSATSVKATLTLAKPAPRNLDFTLASSDPAISLPTTVTIPAGSTTLTFPISHSISESDETVRITATHGLSQISTDVTVRQIVVKSLKLDATSIEGDRTINGIVTLNAAPGKDAQISLDSNAPGLITLPSTVTVRAKATTAVFPIRLGDVPTSTNATVFALYPNGFASAYVTILPKPKLQKVTATYTSLFGLQFTNGAVYLAKPAGDQGATVTLSVPGGGLNVPATVYIYPGMTFATFDIVADDVPTTVRPNLTATYGFSSVGKTFTVQPNVVKEVVLSPSIVQGGQSTDVEVRLAYNVGVDTTVDIALSNPALGSVPTTVTVPAGAISATFTLTTNATTKVRTVAVRATRLGKTAHKTLTINP